MPIIGHGIDIVETHRIRHLLEEHGKCFLDRCYTPAEQEYCARSRIRQVERLSGRFAAKEAVLKALGTGWRGGVAWTDMEILPEPSGQPRLTLSGECERIARAGHLPLAGEHQPHRDARDGQRDRDERGLRRGRNASRDKDG